MRTNKNTVTKLKTNQTVIHLGTDEAVNRHIFLSYIFMQSNFLSDSIRIEHVIKFHFTMMKFVAALHYHIFL